MIAILLEGLSIGITTSVLCRSIKQFRISFSAEISLVCWHSHLDVMWDILSSTLVKLFLQKRDSLNDRSAFFYIFFFIFIMFSQ